jgi:ABC-type dipeptide/oligopeptide/nickel transport system permease subunit
MMDHEALSRDDDGLVVGTSLVRDAARRFVRNRMAMVCLAVSVVMVVFCFLPSLPFMPEDIKTAHITQSRELANQGPSWRFWFGTDAVGRDLFWRVLYGGQISFLVAFVGTFVSLAIGVSYGAIAGYLGNRGEAITSLNPSFAKPVCLGLAGIVVFGLPLWALALLSPDTLGLDAVQVDLISIYVEPHWWRLGLALLTVQALGFFLWDAHRDRDFASFCRALGLTLGGVALGVVVVGGAASGYLWWVTEPVAAGKGAAKVSEVSFGPIFASAAQWLLILTLAGRWAFFLVSSLRITGAQLSNVMMRFVDMLYGLPFMFVVILIMTIVQRETQSLVPIFVALGLVQWLTMARITRGQVISLRDQEFVTAARTIGASTPRIIFRHIVPNLLGPIIVYTTLTIPGTMLQESFLSFLGLGVREPDCSWGSLASDGIQALSPIGSHWWQTFFPCLALALTLFSLNFVGDGLRDALDPKGRK